MQFWAYKASESEAEMVKEAESLGMRLRQQKKKSKRVNVELWVLDGLTWKTVNFPILDLCNGAEVDEEMDSIAVAESADQKKFSAYGFLTCQCVSQRACLFRSQIIRSGFPVMGKSEYRAGSYYFICSSERVGSSNEFPKPESFPIIFIYLFIFMYFFLNNSSNL